MSTARNGFTLQVIRGRLEEYRTRHASVWPEMLAEIAKSGCQSFSIILRDDRLFVGYYEADDEQWATDYLGSSEVAGWWEAEMSNCFENLESRRPDTAEPVIVVFNRENAIGTSKAGH